MSSIHAVRRTMKLPLALATLALVILPATAGAATVGTTSVYTPGTGNSAAVAQAYRFTAQSSGQVDGLNVYLDGSNTAGKVELGVYNGSASSAGALGARCGISSPRANAWNRCSVAAYSVTAGSYYWLALLQPAATPGGLAYREGQVAGGPATY